jgi:hypothetical protein
MILIIFFYIFYKINTDKAINSDFIIVDDDFPFLFLAICQQVINNIFYLNIFNNNIAWQLMWLISMWHGNLYTSKPIQQWENILRATSFFPSIIYQKQIMVTS